MIIIIIAIAFVWAVIDYIRIPKPPNDLTYREREYYYKGGWKEYERQKQIDYDLYLLELKEREQLKVKLYKEIEFLTAQIGMLEDLERLIEKDLHDQRGNNKASLSRLISLDKQIHTAQQKIDKLYMKLESLE